MFLEDSVIGSSLKSCFPGQCACWFGRVHSAVEWQCRGAGSCGELVMVQTKTYILIFKVNIKQIENVFCLYRTQRNAYAT
jgi:hypothetical protein